MLEKLTHKNYSKDFYVAFNVDIAFFFFFGDFTLFKLLINLCCTLSLLRASKVLITSYNTINSTAGNGTASELAFDHAWSHLRNFLSQKCSRSHVEFSIGLDHRLIPTPTKMLDIVFLS